MAVLGCLRLLFILLSLVFVLCGLAGGILIGLFVWVFKSTDTIKDLFKLANKESLFDQLLIAFIVLAGACAVMILTGCFGCCAMGKRRYNRCCQDTLAFFAFVLALLMLSGVVMTAIYRTELKDAVQNSFQINMRAYDQIGGVSDSSVQEFVDTIQSDKECCGSLGYQSWKQLNTSWFRQNPTKLAPESCCRKDLRTTDCNTLATNLFQRGCTKQIEDLSEKAFLAVYAIGGAISCLAFLEVATACYMARTSNNAGSLF